MRIDRPNFARWLCTAALAGVAVWSLSATVAALVHVYPKGWTAMAFVGGFGLAFSVPFALAAHLCFNRQHRELFMVGASVAALVLLPLCFTILNRLGALDALRDTEGDQPWQTALVLFASLALALGPFYVTGQFLRACSRFAARRFPAGPSPRHIQSARRRRPRASPRPASAPSTARNGSRGGSAVGRATCPVTSSIAASPPSGPGSPRDHSFYPPHADR